jgi:hypothetical protein
MKNSTIFFICVCIIVFSLLFMNLQTYNKLQQSQTEKDKISKNLEYFKQENHVIHDEIVKFKKVIKPPKLSSYNEDYELIICSDNYYVSQLSIYTHNIDMFISSNIFKTLSIICSNGESHTIINKVLGIYESHLIEYSSNTDHIFFNKEKSENFTKTEFNCEEKNKKMIGVIYTLESHQLFSYCSDKKVVRTNYHYSPVFQRLTGEYGTMTEYMCEDDTYVGYVGFNTWAHVFESWGEKRAIYYVNHMKINCEKKTESNQNHIFNSVEIYRGQYIDNVIYMKDIYTLSCATCLKGGNRRTFSCPVNTFIVGHREWKIDDKLVGLQFICK